jgi:DNA-binding GntR family transcriptional regulator
MTKESRAARKAANQASKQADAALHANQRKEKAAGIREETPEYLRLNGAANQAAAKASWWRR